MRAGRLSRMVRALRHGADLDRSLDAEIVFHLDMEARKLVAEGLPAEEARAQALRRFGPMEPHKEAARDARGVTWIQQAFADVRSSVRTLARNRGFTLLAVVTLGLGIGANTAVFSVINGVLLKPLPYENGDRLLLLQQSASLAAQPSLGISIKELYDYREQLSSFDGLVEFHQMSFDLLRRGEPDRVDTGVVSPNFFDVLGIRPLLGRTFVPSDDDHGAEAVLVLGYAYWQSRFAGDPAIVGQVFEMNDRPHTVVGVLPPVPHYPNEVDVYMPTKACPFRAGAEQAIETNRRAFSILQVFGLLKQGVAPETAATDVATVSQRWRQDYPEVYRSGLGFRARTAGVLEALTADARRMLLILLGTTVLILVLACANVANLTVARLLRRDREFALRAALGAGRWRLVRQLVTESLVLSVAGGLVGLLFAWATIDLLATFVGRFTVRTGEIALDPMVLAFALLVSLLTGLTFGTFPAVASRVDVMSALRAGDKGTGGLSGGHRIQRALVVAQVAVSVVLLVGAGLLLTSFYRLQRVDPGFRADSVLSAEVFGNFTKYPDAASLRRLYVNILERVQAAPGVTSAAITNAVPLDQLQPGQTRFSVRGRAYSTPDERPVTDVRVVSPDYFMTLGVRLVEGRLLSELDHEEAAPVVVINETLSRREWNGRNPLGAEVAFGNGQNWARVVGIVADVKTFGLEADAAPQAYVPLRQSNGLAGSVLVRGAGNQVRLASVIREAVRNVDPDLPIENVSTLDEKRSQYLATPRLTAMLLMIFAALALLVTLTGITGVIAQSVAHRMREFGVRMALGASQQRVLTMVLRQGLLLVTVGLTLGVAASLAFARVLESYLYETTSTDPLTLLGVALGFVTAGTVACLGPAWRATRVDPAHSLSAD